MKTRRIDAHKDGSFLNQLIEIEALGEPGKGGANHTYMIRSGGPAGCGHQIQFQSKDPADGIDGLSMEALLAICADRLVGFQAGTFACDENANALACIHRAAHFLAERTRARIAGGKEAKAEPAAADAA